jgi:hypothetical protein
MFWFSKKEKDLEDRVDDYVDQHGVSTRQLNLALWYIRNHKKFFLAIAGILIAAALVLWGYAAVRLIMLVFTADQEQASINASLHTSVVSPKIDYLKNIDYSFQQILPAGLGKYDFVGQIKNNNPKVGMDFNYHFVVNGQALSSQVGFVLPQETKYLLALGKQIDVTPTSVALVIDNIGWKKINAHLISDWATYQNDHINFIIEDKKFLPATQSGLSDKLALSDLSFLATNMTAYNYLQMNFIIILHSGSQIVGVSRHIVNDFKSRAQEKIGLSLVGDFANVDNIDIIPEVNILDEGVFDKVD